MSKVLSVPLSADGLNRAADWLENYAKRTLPKNAAALVSRMTGQGEQWAINFMGHIDTGNTLASIVGIRNGNKGVIVAGGAAIWIEFGTGVAKNGEGYNHPKAQELGMAAHGTYGLGRGASYNGWYYPDPEGKYVYNGQTWSHTFGIPASRFMYNTAQALRREYPNMAKEIFDK